MQTLFGQANNNTAEYLWQTVKKAFDEYPLDKIASAYVHHSQMANAMIKYKGGDGFERECKALHVGHRKSVKPLYNTDKDGGGYVCGVKVLNAGTKFRYIPPNVTSSYYKNNQYGDYNPKLLLSGRLFNEFIDYGTNEDEDYNYYFNCKDDGDDVDLNKNNSINNTNGNGNDNDNGNYQGDNPARKNKYNNSNQSHHDGDDNDDRNNNKNKRNVNANNKKHDDDNDEESHRNYNNNNINNNHSQNNSIIQDWDVNVRNNKWIIRNMERDGNCLFHSLVYQLTLLTLLHLLIIHQRQQEDLHMTLRRVLVNHMEQNGVIFDPFVVTSRNNPTAYYHNMKRSGVYGGNQELFSFSLFFKVPVTVLDRRGIIYNHHILPNEIPVEYGIVAAVVYDSVSKHYDTAVPLYDNDNDDSDNNSEDENNDNNDHGAGFENSDDESDGNTDDKEKGKSANDSDSDNKGKSNSCNNIASQSDFTKHNEHTAELEYYKKLDEKYDIGDEVKKIQDYIKSNNDQGGGYYTGTAEELNIWKANRNKIFADRMMDGDMPLSNYFKKRKIDTRQDRKK